ncbi:unnamed protein product [Prunus brigantina]
MEVLLVVEKSHWSPFVNLRRQHPLPQWIPLSRHRCPPGHEFWEASGMALRARGNLVMFQSEKEKKKQLSKEDKKALQEEKLKQEEKYMWAIVDGVKEKGWCNERVVHMPSVEGGRIVLL